MYKVIQRVGFGHLRQIQCFQDVIYGRCKIANFSTFDINDYTNIGKFIYCELEHITNFNESSI